MSESRTEKQQHWAKVLEQAEASGMTLVDYARTHDLPVQALYQWRSTLSRGARTTTETSVSFAQVVTQPFSNGLTVELDAARLRFDALPDPQWLGVLLRSQCLRS